MLRIYPVCLEVLRELRPYVVVIERVDKDHARQLRRSSMSVPLNVAEGSGAKGGNRGARYCDALGSARETRANLQAAEAAGYLKTLDAELMDKLDRIIATLVVVTR